MLLVRTTMLAFLVGTGMAYAQVVSPLGGSTSNPQSRPPVTAAPAAPSRTTAPMTSTTPTAPATPMTSSTPHTATSTSTHVRRTLADRFAAANTTHDGKLTIEQARTGHLNSTVRDFALIDTSKQGYVTLDQIKAFRAARRSHRAPRAPKPAQ